MKIRAIVNRSGGTLKGSADEEARIVAAFDAAGVDADVRMTDSADIFQAMKEAAAAPGLDALVAGGGDGTLSCAAGHLADTGRAFGILPLGTLNHLARDAGIPFGIEEAAAVIAAGHVREVDVAEINGRVFVNNSSVGLYPDMVRLREAQQERSGRGKRLAMLSASFASLRAFRRHRLWISAPGLEAPIKTPLLFVGNNRYQVKQVAAQMRAQLASQAQTRRQCITAAEAANVGRNLVGADATARGCQFSDSTFAGGVIRIGVNCRQPGGQASMRMAVAGSFSGTQLNAGIRMNLTGPSQGSNGVQAINMTGRVTGRRIGECPAGGVAPPVTVRPAPPTAPPRP